MDDNQPNKLTAASDFAPAGRLAISVEELAVGMGIGRAAAYEAIKRGEFPTLKIGRRILVPIAALEKMLAGAA